MTAWHDSLTKKHQVRRAHKYKASIGVSDDGKVRGSKLERAVYAVLMLMERAGEILNIRTQQEIELFPGQTHKIDFVVFDKKRNSDIFVEAKGFKDPTWAEKKKAYKAFSPLPLQIWEGDYKYPTVTEEIPPGKYKWVQKD